jgi:lycopene cyclase domain-containing protein
MTYLGLALVFLAAAVALTVAAAAARRPRREWWVATAAVAAALLVLTAVFDSMMILADLFRYDAGALAGARAWLAPVEDLAWPLAAALLLPALWELLGPRDDARADAGHDERTQR